MYRLNEPTEIWIGSPTDWETLTIKDDTVSIDDIPAIVLFDPDTSAHYCADVRKGDEIDSYQFRFPATETVRMTADADMTLEIYDSCMSDGEPKTNAVPIVRITNYAYAVRTSRTDYDN